MKRPAESWEEYASWLGAEFTRYRADEEARVERLERNFERERRHRDESDDFRPHETSGTRDPLFRCAHHPVEVPTVGNALQLVLACVLEGEIAPGDQVLDGLRHEHF